MALGTLAQVIASGGRGGKLSVQVDFPWLDQNGGQYPGGPTSLQQVLKSGGNLWVHNHDGSYDHLQSTWMTVASAYASEHPSGPVAMSVATPETAGRSGGADINDETLDWVSITVAAGIRRMNSPVVNYYAMTPESLRPYRMSAKDMGNSGVYFHDAAPGPLQDSAPTTMRQRPFWVEASTKWDENISCTFPNEVTVQSLLMIPNPGRVHLGGLAEGRSAYQGAANTITPQDLAAALTEVWSTYEQMEDYQGSISNVWYIHVQPGLLTSGAQVNDVPLSIGAWVDSVNALLNVPNSAVWMNPNEITSNFWNTTSAWW